jgi:hypothetical protein
MIQIVSFLKFRNIAMLKMGLTIPGGWSPAACLMALELEGGVEEDGSPLGSRTHMGTNPFSGKVVTSRTF